MQLKINRKLNFILLIYTVLLLGVIIFLVVNRDIWDNNRMTIIVTLIVASTLFLVMFKYYEANYDKKIINKMTSNGNIALARIEKGTFNRIIKDSNNRKYTIWDLNVTLYDQNNEVHKMTFSEKFASTQTSIPNGFIYVTYDTDKPEAVFIIPNMLLGAFENIPPIIQNYEKTVKDIRYLNVYFTKGIVLETFKESLRKKQEEKNNG